MLGIVAQSSQHDLENVPGVGSYLWHVADDVLEWSPGLIALYGLSSPPVDEAGFYSLLHPEDRLRVEAETTAFLEHCDRYSHEFRIVMPDGGVRHILDRAAIRRAADGQVIAVQGINIDITEQRVSDPNVGFRALADNIDQLAWIADRDGSIYWYNKRWFEFTGTTLDEMKGWGWRGVHHPDHVGRVVDRISQCFATGIDWEDTFPLRGANGSYRWFLSRARAIRDAEGNIHAWFGTNTDVTEQRELEELSGRLQRQFEMLADSMPQLVWTANIEGQVTYYNRRIKEFWPAIDMATGVYNWRNVVHPDDLELTERQWSAASLNRCDYSCEHRLRMADGSYRWHLSRAIAHTSESEVYWFGTATDIDALMSSEQHRKVLVEKLNHRVKNILTLVQAIASMSFKELTDPKISLNSFQSRLGALARAHDRLVSDEYQEIGLEDIIWSTADTLGVIRSRLDIDGENIRLSGRAGVMVAMAIHELSTNAIKYGALSNDVGSVIIRCRSLSADSDFFEITWTETGGPSVQTPSRQGFGSRLIRQALASTIGGSAHFVFEPSGLICTISGRHSLNS